jgi:PAS domain S-box-containing protein
MHKKTSCVELKQRVKALENQSLELKRKEKALRGTEQMYRDRFENAPIAYFSIRADNGSILRANSEAVRLLGYSKETMTRMNVLDLYSDTPHGISKAKKLFNRFQAGKSIRGEELQMKRKDGKSIWINLNVEPLRHLDGECFESRSMVIDISEHKIAEEALRKSEKKYRLLVETMNDGLALLNKKALLTYVNDKFCEMLGYQRDEIIGRPAVDILPKRSQTIFERHFTLRKKGARTRYEMAFLRNDGQEMPTIVSGAPIFDDGGHFSGAFAVITDIFDRKKIERELDIKATKLEELNTTLKVLLKRRERDKSMFEENVLINIKELVMTYLEKLKRSRLSNRQRTYLNILESNLKDIASPFARNLSLNLWDLTHKEIEVANLVKYGMSTKEIAALFNLSIRTIESHRKSIRKKLGITKKKSNLRAYLLSLP